MKEKVLRGNGRVFFGDDLIDDKGMRVGRDFFQSLSEASYKNLAQYWRALDESEHLFTYTERQSPSFLMPALFSITDGAAICEYPLKRLINDEDATAFLDYWAYYRKFNIAIEVKHSWYNLNKEGIKSTNDKWKAANNQLNQLQPEYITNDEPFFKLNLMLITFWAKKEWQPDGTKGNSFTPEHADPVYDYHNYIKTELKDPTPNIWSYWALPEQMIKIENGDEGKDPCFYPALAMYGHLDLIYPK